MDWLDYREKLGIGFNDEQKFLYFRTILFNKLRTSIRIPELGEVSSNEYFIFCNKIGKETDLKLRQEGEDSKLSFERYNECISIIDHHASYLEELLSCYVAFMESVSKRRQNGSHILSQKDYLKVLQTSLDSAHIQYTTIEDSGNYYIFPKGVKELDDALVSQPLEWLKDYPEAEKAWSKALKEYANEDSEKASDVADLFRKALETFFKEFFNSKKALENLKGEYGDYLTSQGVPTEIKQNFETLLQAYTNYMNGYAKHRDATSDKVLEYLMYQTGNIMRLLITLKQGEQQDAD